MVNYLFLLIYPLEYLLGSFTLIFSLLGLNFNVLIHGCSKLFILLNVHMLFDK